MRREGVVGAGGGSSCAAGLGAADVPGDSATVGLVSCHGGGGSGVSGDRGWTFNGGAIAGRTGVDVDT